MTKQDDGCEGGIMPVRLPSALESALIILSVISLLAYLYGSRAAEKYLTLYLKMLTNFLRMMGF